MATPTSLPASFTSGQVLTAAQMNNLRGAFRVLQVVSAFSTTDQSTTSGTNIDLTGASVTITPSSTSNTVLILFNTCAQAGGGTVTGTYQLMRGASNIFEENSLSLDVGYVGTLAINHYDSPSTTSATTYKIQFRRSVNTWTNLNFQLVAMEISA